ncbi:MAG TPA: guanylate kinase [Candidatus Sulfotelmatobacter sp.]|jgi:guanylate kinase
MSPHKPIVYIISAPSGSGKSTLVNELLKLVPNLDFSISYTTRDSRGSEQNGKEYYFIPREEFEQMIQAGEFLEYATVFGKSYYGTARRFLREAEQKGNDLLLDIDVQGAAQIKQKCPDAVSIFVLPPDRHTLEWRLRHRSEDDEATIQRRLGAASREIENYDKYDYILINDDLKESIESLTAIVRFARLCSTLTAEDRRIVDLADQCRLTRVGKRLRPILESFRNLAPPPQP